MKMKKIITLLSTLAIASVSVMAQNSTTVTFKPNSNIGEDALVWWTPNNCVIGHYLPLRNGSAQTQNFGDLADLMIDHWTFNGMQNNGCPEGKRKVLIRFTEISNIPANARIISATLKLYNPPQQYGGEYNSIYPGSPFRAPNTGTLARIMPGQSNNWQEMTVNWDQSELLTLAPNSQWVNIPNSTRKYNETLSLNVTNIVQAIVTDMTNQVAFANNGFLLQLDNLEEIYRKWYFASSDNNASAYHPELIVSYTLDKDEDCNANFTTAFSTLNPSEYTFSAHQNNAQYEWTINGSTEGNNQNLNYLLKDGQIEVCLKVTLPNEEISCTQCTKISSNSTSIKGRDVDNYLAIFPNPSSDYWNINLKNIQYTNASYQIIDPIGRVMVTNSINQNNFQINNQKLANGIYTITINVDGIILHKKLIKQ